ncbi:MAG: ATP-dependent DNA helicase RecG [Candidatus Pelagibacter sp.]|nr:ATP-dependent DNA helicase RecG [Candidatus Pelagibacter sp.]
MKFEDLFSSVKKIKGVGPVISKKLSDKGIENKIDLFLNLPTGAIDRRFCPKLDQLEVGVISTIFVRPVKYTIPRFRNLPNRVTCKDEYGSIDIIFFNSRESYIKQILPLNEEVVISGKVGFYKNKYQMTNPDYIQSIDKEKDITKIMAKYSSVAGISPKTIQKIYKEEIEKLKDIGEWHSQDFLKKMDWPTWYDAIYNLHNPINVSDVNKESKFYQRLAFDEIFSNFLIFSEIKKRIKKLIKVSKVISDDNLLRIKKILPFTLTESQQGSLKEILTDISSEKKMLRVLQGDVGSGKTAVAMIAAYLTVKSGYQVAFLCPTELLAKQHFLLFKKVLENENLNIQLLTSKIKGSEQVDTRFQLSQNKIDIVVGTHSLFQEKTTFNNLGLIVIDEQHKFGVQQRINLSLKGSVNTDVLLMTATPIPRTLILTNYGDMDISTINEKPFNNTTINTLAKPAEKMDDVMVFLKKRLDENDQVYWVTPLIEESEKLKLTPAVKRYEYLKKKLKVEVGLVHGAMKSEDKNKIMEDFISGKIKVIVSTTVIEVGIDNQNANTMIIENCERFGLSQLHQLRGRVGRGKLDAYCLLLYSKNIGTNGKKRIQILKSSLDGFYISEEDLKLRGFGDIIGYKQSGEKDFIIADPAYHSDLFQLAKEEIENLENKDVKLEEHFSQLLKIFKKDRVLNIIDTG